MQAQKLTITYDGVKIAVDGPIQDKGLCYAMLELAKDEIAHWHQQQKGAAKIEAVTNGRGKEVLASLAGG